MPKISVHDLMTISRVLLLIIGQNDINPKLLQPIVASICKVIAVKKPCVHQSNLNRNLGKFENKIKRVFSLGLEGIHSKS